MDFRESLQAAKDIDMVDYLSTLGFTASKIRNNDFWYYSPLRQEKTPSFKINRKLNRWYDHGLGKGGSLIDFGILYNRCSITEFLQNLNRDLSFQNPSYPSGKKYFMPENKLEILEHSELSSPTLLAYLKQRCISIEMAKKYCRQVRYRFSEKKYHGIGFRNDSGGFEIRNPYFKSSSSPKDMTTFKNKAGQVLVFEGFMDFLSFRSIVENRAEARLDFVVLNSLSFFEKARPFMEQHQSVGLYLDNDTAGERYTKHALSLHQKYKDKSDLYHNFKDLNDWAVSSDKILKKNKRLRID